jgi:hypothetical protein
MKTHRLVAVGILACLFLQNVHAFDLSSVRIPDNTEAYWVGQGINHNGVSMDIKQLQSKHSSDELITYYKNMWEADGGGEGVGYTVQDAGDFKIISKIEGNHNIVVQLRDDSRGHAEGYLSAIDISTLDGANSNDDFPSLANTTLISKTITDDPGKSAVTRVMMNNHSVESNVNFYKSKLESDGWKHAYSHSENKSFVGFYNRDNKSMEIAVSKQPGKETVIFVNIVEEG